MDQQDYASGSASLFATAARQPDFCLAPLMSTSDGKTMEVIGIKFGEAGYYKTTYGRQTREWIAEQNIRMGIDGPTAMAFETCSIFGTWSNYETIKKHLQEAIDKAEVK